MAGAGLSCFVQNQFWRSESRQEIRLFADSLKVLAVFATNESPFSIWTRHLLAGGCLACEPPKLLARFATPKGNVDNALVLGFKQARRLLGLGAMQVAGDCLQQFDVDFFVDRNA